MIAKLIIELTPNEYQLGSDDELNMGETRNNNKDNNSNNSNNSNNNSSSKVWGEWNNLGHDIHNWIEIY